MVIVYFIGLPVRVWVWLFAHAFLMKRERKGIRESRVKRLQRRTMMTTKRWRESMEMETEKRDRLCEQSYNSGKEGKKVVKMRVKHTCTHTPPWHYFFLLFRRITNHPHIHYIFDIRIKCFPSILPCHDHTHSCICVRVASDKPLH